MPVVLGLVRAVQVFDTFTPGIDSWGEHDKGSIVWHKNTTLWKGEKMQPAHIQLEVLCLYWRRHIDEDRGLKKVRSIKEFQPY
jgi:uncharacterized protein DUF3768